MRLVYPLDLRPRHWKRRRLHAVARTSAIAAPCLKPDLSLPRYDRSNGVKALKSVIPMCATHAIPGACLMSRSVARAAATTIPAPKRSDVPPAATRDSVSTTMAEHAGGRIGCGPPLRFDEHFIKWIPLAVPMFAVMLAAGAYFILGMVL